MEEKKRAIHLSERMKKIVSGENDKESKHLDFPSNPSENNEESVDLNEDGTDNVDEQKWRELSLKMEEDRNVSPDRHSLEEGERLAGEWEKKVLNSKEVVLPHSPLNVVWVKNRASDELGEAWMEFSRWNLAQHTLKRKIRNAKELLNAVSSMNPQKEKGSLNGILEFFYVKEFEDQFRVDGEISSEEFKVAKDKPPKCGFTTIGQCNDFFNKTLPFIQSIALECPTLFPNGLSKLVQNETKEIILNRKQAACLLANAFFCTFLETQLFQTPNGSGKNEEKDIQGFPSFSFSGLWKRHIYSDLLPSQEAAKVFCFIHYFERISEDENIFAPNNRLIYKRRSLKEEDLPEWKQSPRLVASSGLSVEIFAAGSIEESKGDLQVDFANLSLGGGVFSGGCVQEEIRFSVCPELAVGMLFTSFLKDLETVVLKGAEQFSDYKGYAGTLEYAGDYRDSNTVIDGVIDTTVIAMDAFHFWNKDSQFEERWIIRELNKSYSGFFLDADDIRPPKAIATGNWGCGVFNGNKQLKFLIQLISSSANDRPLKYYTFGDGLLKQQIGEMYKLLLHHQVTIGKLVTMMIKYGKSDRRTDVFEWVLSKLEGKSCVVC